MTQIQTEIARLQVMAAAVFTAFPESQEAKELVNCIPALEAIRSTAEKEINETGGVSPETYNAASLAMAGAEDKAWSLHGDYAHASTKLACRQLDNIHIMMNAAVPSPTEGLKCWPPGDPHCP